MVLLGATGWDTAGGLVRAALVRAAFVTGIGPLPRCMKKTTPQTPARTKAAAPRNNGVRPAEAPVEEAGCS